MLNSFGNMTEAIRNIPSVGSNNNKHFSTAVPKNVYSYDVNKRKIMFNALLNPKPDPYGNALYNYACFNKLDEIIENIECFSPCEKHSVINKLEENMKLGVKHGWKLENCWGETKTDIDEFSGIKPNAQIRNKLLDPLYFTEEELQNLEKELEFFKIYLQNCDNQHKNLWFKQRYPIFQNILRSFDNFSHVELIVLYKYLKEKEGSL